MKISETLDTISKKANFLSQYLYMVHPEREEIIRLIRDIQVLACDCDDKINNTLKDMTDDKQLGFLWQL
jgi:hypothetical protein